MSLTYEESTNRPDSDPAWDEAYHQLSVEGKNLCGYLLFCGRFTLVYHMKHHRVAAHASARRLMPDWNQMTRREFLVMDVMQTLKRFWAGVITPLSASNSGMTMVYEFRLTERGGLLLDEKFKAGVCPHVTDYERIWQRLV